MKVAFDLDGVLYPWHEIVYKDYWVKWAGVREDYRTFWRNFMKYPESAWKEVASIPHFYTYARTLPHAITVLSDLQAVGHELLYITHRPDNSIVATRWWLNFMQIPSGDALYVTPDKRIVVEEIGVDWLVDDREKILANVDDICKTILVKQPWNRPAWNSFRTANNLIEVRNIILEEVTVKI